MVWQLAGCFYSIKILKMLLKVAMKTLITGEVMFFVTKLDSEYQIKSFKSNGLCKICSFQE